MHAEVHRHKPTDTKHSNSMHAWTDEGGLLLCDLLVFY